MLQNEALSTLNKYTDFNFEYKFASVFLYDTNILQPASKIPSCGLKW